MKLTDDEWNDLTEIRDVFEDCYIFTKKVQSTQMTISDFYAEWIDMKFKLKKMPVYDLAEQLLYYMERREAKFMESPITLSALFLDARYRVLLNDKPMAAQMAINHLACLYKRIRDLCPLNLPSFESTSSVPNDDQNNNDFDNYLDSLDQGAQYNSQPACEGIMPKLVQFDIEMKSKKRNSKKNHVMNFWEANKTVKPELFELAKIVFAVASTEVSVERNFSALAFILNKYRCSLTDAMLDEILFVRLNKNLFRELV